MSFFDLKKNIEKKRVELHTLLTTYEPTDKNVVICSQNLDNLIVMYEMLYCDN